jgi:aspartate/methionine/tyrosine aminotransferase
MTSTNTGLMPFQAMEMAGRAKQLEASGRSICHLETGEPGALPAPRVLEAVTAAMRGPQGYTSSMGRIELREALARYYAERHSIEVDPGAICVTMGSSAGFILSFLAAFDPGAAIAVTRPGYPAYLNTIAGLGFRAVEISVHGANGWRLGADDIAVAHAKTPFAGLLFASPANPTGASVDGPQLAAIIETCARLGVRLISDEIYHGLDFRGPSISAGEFSRDPIIINSFSKYYCMTGWRVGWLVLPPDLIRKTTMLQQSLFIAAPTLGQVAAEVALGERDYYEVQKALYRRNETILHAGLGALGFGGVRHADGAFYAYVDVSTITNDSMQFCRDLLETTGVCITPGVDFDRVDGHNFVRLSYAGSQATMVEALARMDDFIKRPSCGPLGG